MRLLSPQKLFDLFLLHQRIRLIRGRKSQLIQDVANVSPFHFLLKGARRNIPHDEPLGQSETKTITLRIHSIQVIPSGLLMSYRISLSEGVASVVSSRLRSECRVLVIWTPILTGQMLHIALRCLEGSTMSNLVHRRRRCARIDPYMVLLPGGQYARG